MPEVGAALCATHEGAQSTGTCARCGNFVCPLCLDEFSGLPDHCEACREHEGGGIIAFEREDLGFLKRWFQTTRDVLLSPTRTFETTRPGSIGASLGYVAFTGVAMGGTMAVCGGCAVGMLGVTGAFAEVLPAGQDTAYFYGVLVAALASYLLLMPLGLILSAVIRSAVFHAVAKVLGAQGGYGASLWATSYLHAVSLVWMPLAVLQQIPILGPFISLAAWIGIEAYYALQLTTVARRYHGLTDGRAAAAGWAGFLTVTVLGGLCCFSAVLLAVMGRA